MTQALSTRLKLSLDPLVYAYDSPGVMLPYLGRGLEGAERGVKLALIGMLRPQNGRISRTGANHSSSLSAAGIKEGLYDIEALAAYLLYRLNTINSICEFLLLVESALCRRPSQICLTGNFDFLSFSFKLDHQF